ncbi:pre-peptidase C-terminal domain-containing protein [Hyphobacterium marinum]|uniref:Pre-peptidase C-terminal domain-containing protein n=1 Tax=Hyphobacterium marinum TaxID=3116574 RepID=A0ABU7LVT4_9PROT|nr:pre-peptidase C-terminal domain-containing protein [Hyphobacterium sp. Y6023]MEE2565080.1 pre-peptidase C-terminal domain-containing protein [Hyphobacterium sp. Y6023]
MRFGVLSVVFACAAAPVFAQDTGGDVRPGEVSAEQPRADFELDLSEGQMVTLTTRSDTNFDTVLQVLDANGRVLAENDDYAGGGLQSQVIFQPPAPGFYTAAVTGYGGGFGSFELDVHEGVDFGLSGEADILFQEVVSLANGSPTQSVRVNFSAGDIAVINTFAITPGIDTTLELRGPNGAVIAQNDDSQEGGTLDSQIILEISESGQYAVIAGSYSGSDTGDLMLSVATDPNADVPYDFSAIGGEEIARYTGTIDDTQPSREYPVTLTAGQTLLALADATSGELDTVLRILGPDGQPVALNDDRGDGSLNSAIALTASETGEYTVSMERYRGSNGSGEFSLVLSLVDAVIVDELRTLRENINLSGEVRTIRTEDFIVHYTLEGVDASSEAYALEVGASLQENLDAQVAIGFAEPIRDSDGYYRAFVSNVGGALGFARPVETVFDNPFTGDVREEMASRAVFVIDNDFVGLGDAGASSLIRATATHELNHIVQYGYDAIEELDWLYESTASWIETVTVGEDQDATDYVAADFSRPGRCWSTPDEGLDYGQWTLLQSIADVHGNRMVVRFWENAVHMDGLETMDAALRDAGSDLTEAVTRWRAQNYALDYDLAPVFTSTVEMSGTLSGTGSGRAKGRIEELGVNYLALDLDGPATLSVTGTGEMAMFLLGQRGGEIQVIPLGQSGTVEPGQWETASLMVINTALPPSPGVCTGENYQINITEPGDDRPGASYRFSDRHFIVPGEDDEEEQAVEAAPE